MFKLFRRFVRRIVVPDVYLNFREDIAAKLSDLGFKAIEITDHDQIDLTAWRNDRRMIIYCRLGKISILQVNDIANLCVWERHYDSNTIVIMTDVDQPASVWSCAKERRVNLVIFDGSFPETILTLMP